MKNTVKLLALACAATVMLTACGNDEIPLVNQGETSSSKPVSTPNNSKPTSTGTPAASSAPAESSTPDTTSTPVTSSAPAESSVPDSTPDTTSTPEAPKEIDWSTVPYTYDFVGKFEIGKDEASTSIRITAYEGNEKVVNFPPTYGYKVIAISLTEGNFDFTDLNIPDSVTAIEDDDFKLCTNLTSVNIPDSVTKIGTSAFSNCPNIKVKYNGKEYDYDHLDSLYSDINGN